MIPFKSNFWTYLFDATFDNRHGEVGDVLKIDEKRVKIPLVTLSVASKQPDKIEKNETMV